MSDFNSALRTIVPGIVYSWIDHTTFFGLEDVAHLDLESKRRELFGHCDIENYLTPERTGIGILFNTYIGIELTNKDVNPIYFPSVFMNCCFVLKKKLGSDWSWPRHRTHSVVCLMNQPRYPRLIASCWLANNAGDIDFVYTQNWDSNERQAALYELFQLGGMKDWTGTWGPNLAQLPENRVGLWKDNDLTTNFEMLYDAAYSRAAVAVVIGAVCWERGSEICEKYLFSVLSGCIPIVQGYGVYDRLRRLGFDTFDDLIDTSSQWDTNPITAAWNMWEHNRDFLTQAKDIAADPQIQTRLQHNFDLALDLKQLRYNAIHALNDAKAQQIWYEHQLWSNLNYFNPEMSWDRLFSS